MGYLNTYGRTRKYQGGGGMPPAAGDMGGAPGGDMGGAPGGAPGGEMGGAPGGAQEMDEQQLIQLAEAAMQGDQEAAAQLGFMLAPMILEQAQAMMGGGGAEGAPAEEVPAEGGTPVFRHGGAFLGKY